MFNSSLHKPQHFRRNLEPTIIFLEPEHFEKAREISQNVTGERNQWKTYLNAIALFGFEEWLQELVPSIKIDIHNASIFAPQQYHNLTNAVCNIQLGHFKLCLITIDDLVDDWITVPENIINSPQLAAQLYVLLEVKEEEEELVIHGFIHGNEIVKYQRSINVTSINQDNNSLKIPFSHFDTEVNNLLLYSRFLEVEAISFPEPEKNTIADTVITSIGKATDTVTQSLINLGQWSSGKFEEGWYSLEEIFTPQTPVWGYLKSPVRENPARGNLTGRISSESLIEKGKLFDLESLPNEKGFALIVKIKPEEDKETGVLVQIRPENEYCLPQGLKLKVTLNHNTKEAESESAIARECDQIIQLAFSEGSGKKFKVEAIYQDAVFAEEFVL